jgi:thymidylate kinase
MPHVSAKLPDDSTECPLPEIFAFFERNHIAYCVLGNPASYPWHYVGDVDLAVSAQTFSRGDSLIRQLCQETGLRWIQKLHHEETACAYILCWFEKKGDPQFLMLDICSDYLQNGKCLLDSEALLFNAAYQSAHACRVAEPAMAFIYYLLKKVGKQTLTNQHGQYLSTLYHQNSQGASTQISMFWPVALQPLITQAALSENWKPVQQALPKLLETTRVTKRISLLQELQRKMGRLLNPTGLLVVVLGPDGCGKSAVIQQLLNTMAGGFRQTCHFHLRPRLGLKTPADSTPVTCPHAQPARNILFSLLKVVYFWLDYSLGYWFKLRWFMARSGLVVFDRYYYDMMIDPKRFRYQGSPWLVEKIGQWIPRPDLVILLDAPTAVLQSRKQEVPPEETERQRQAFLTLVSNLPNGYTVNASLPLPDVVRQVEQIILNRMETCMDAAQQKQNARPSDNRGF